MVLFAALLLAHAPAVTIPNLPRPRPRPQNALVVTAAVEVLRAERIGAVTAPDALLRQVRRDARGLTVEFD